MSLLVLATLLPIAVLFVEAAVPLVPATGKSIMVTVSGKARAYYIVTKSESVKLEVGGPVKVEVLSRLAIPTESSGAHDYTVNVLENGQTFKKHKSSTEKSDASFQGLSDIPGKSKKFTLNVPDGTHNYEFRLENTDLNAAALRFVATHRGVRSGNDSPTKKVRIEPLSYDRPASAMVGEKLIAYYVSSKQKNAMLRVIGPTRVTVNARLNFDAQMQGEQKYSLSVVEGAKPVATKSFSTTRSAGVFYENWKEVVPGKSNSFSFGVPEGEHIYRISLGNTLAQSVSLKFSIPQKDIENRK